MLAPYQKLTTIILFLLALAAFFWTLPLGWTWALAAAAFMLWGHSLWIALAMAMAARLNRHDPAPNANLRQWVHAWWHESLAAWRVFMWRQPFRPHSIGDYVPTSPELPANAAGVVLIHGFLCNRAFWNPYLRELKKRGVPFIAVNLEPVLGSIDMYPPLIEKAVQTLTESTGRPVHLVCHSMGGLAARAWLQGFDGYKRVGKIFTLGSPHHGTAFSVGTLFANTQQMERFSAWQRQLEARETAGQYARFVCCYSHCDNVVVPASSATLMGAHNRLVQARGHIDLAFEPALMHEILRAVASAGA